MTPTRVLLAAGALAIAMPLLTACQNNDGAAPSTVPGQVGPLATGQPVSTAPSTQPSTKVPGETKKNAVSDKDTPAKSVLTVPEKYTKASAHFEEQVGGTDIFFGVPEGWRREEHKFGKNMREIDVRYVDPTGKVTVSVETRHPEPCCEPKAALREKEKTGFAGTTGLSRAFLETIACCTSADDYKMQAASLGVEYTAQAGRYRAEYRAVNMGSGVAIFGIGAPVDDWSNALLVLNRGWADIEFAG